jgi:broad specificity phosphatase PhoE
MSGRIILVRHGEPVDHAGRCVGHLDIGLSPAAHASLRQLGETIADTPPRLVVTSDLRRAADSAALLARAWGAELRFDRRLRELAFGNWEGRAWSEIANTDRAALDGWGADWTQFAPPGGETGRALEERARSALDDLRRTAMPRSCVSVVSHAGWIRVATTILLNEPLATAFDRTIDYARAAVFDLQDGRFTLSAWNVDALGGAAITSVFAPPPTPP